MSTRPLLHIVHFIHCEDWQYFTNICALGATMSTFQTKAAPSSRVTKPKTKASGFRRSASNSPLSSFPRRKNHAIKAKALQAQLDEDEDFEDELDDAGLVSHLAPEVQTTAQAILYIRENMLDPIPEQRAGMNSVRIAEVLNYRKSLPPIVTVAHVQALLNAPTKVEREIAELVKNGAIRKIVVPGRGGMGEAIVLVKDLEELVNASTLADELKESFLSTLRKYPSAPRLPRNLFTKEVAQQLMSAGFITSATPSWTSADIYSSPGDGLRGTLTSLAAIQKAAAGPAAFNGGSTVGSLHEAGGSGGHVRTSGDQEGYNVSLPNIGSYLKLLSNSRSRLTSLLARSKFRQYPEGYLKERWNGGVPGDDVGTQRKVFTGEFTGVLPGRTTKWKNLYGVTFEWALEECVGAGMIEVFETRSVGRGVRVI